MINLFDAAEKISPNNFFVVYNSEVAKVKVSEIFDSVFSILGIDNVDHLNKFNDGLSRQAILFPKLFRQRSEQI